MFKKIYPVNLVCVSYEVQCISWAQGIRCQDEMASMIHPHYEVGLLMVVEVLIFLRKVKKKRKEKKNVPLLEIASLEHVSHTDEKDAAF